MKKLILAVSILLGFTSGCANPDQNPVVGESEASQRRQAPHAVDPGARGGAAGAGNALPQLEAGYQAQFDEGLDTFQEIDTVRGGNGTSAGLGPRFNLDSCVGCHAQPAPGGSSPAANPQLALATRDHQTVPWFVAADGPVREARFKRNQDGTRDGGVHDLFVITGRTDNPPGCSLAQPDFGKTGNPLTGQGGNQNVVFRIPTPLFGAGLIESIPDAAILANMSANAAKRKGQGISGHPNRSGNDGTITRFGWKAQNKSLIIFAGEAYNVEQGVTNDLFPQEREDASACLVNALPEDRGQLDPATLLPTPGDADRFATFMRLLAPPTPAPLTPGAAAGRATFSQVGCALCHTPTMTTSASPLAALDRQAVNLYSDLLLHDMGTELADDIPQGAAGPSEFRTAPLWGVGQRLFFLHDGRTADLLQAIEAHASSGSEANGVINQFNRLSDADAQNVLTFLRSL